MALPRHWATINFPPSRQFHGRCEQPRQAGKINYSQWHTLVLWGAAAVVLLGASIMQGRNRAERAVQVSESEVVSIIVNRVVHSAWAENAGRIAKSLRSNKLIGNWSGSDG